MITFFNFFHFSVVSKPPIIFNLREIITALMFPLLRFRCRSVSPDDFQLIFQRNPLKYFKMIFNKLIFPLIITIFSNRNVEITPFFFYYFPHKNFFCNTNNTFRFCQSFFFFFFFFFFAPYVFFDKNICN